ncbi:MAG: GNAT family N-acetyltransferase [Ferruginibacter sp.]
MIPVQKVGIESIPVIQNLAERTWQIAYSSIISPEQMKYMLDLFYSEASLKKQIQDGHQFIIAKEKGKAIGFASYSVKSSEEQDTYRLHKIYIDPSQQGKGIGKLLIGFIINDISTYDAINLELNVNRKNKAMDFYKKIGFNIVREEDINIGNGFFMNDYVMNLPLHVYS